MCGIYGLTAVNEQLIQQMTEINRQRGPDGTHYLIGDNFSFGFNHLSIDAQYDNSVKQPFVTDSGNVLLWNGEIYDVHEPDTAWLARNFENYGPAMLRSHSGMWSVAWFDKAAQHLHLVRDHFATKPLFFTIQNDVLYFASAIKSLAGISGVDTSIDEDMLEVSKECIDFVPGPRTLYKDIHKIPPGGHYVWSMKDKRFISKTNLIDFVSEPIDEKRFDMEYFRSMLKHCVIEASKNMWPTGLMLSGGLDSNSILSILAKTDIKITAFTSGFKRITKEQSIERLEDHMHDLYEESEIAMLSASYHKVNLEGIRINQRHYLHDNKHHVADFFGLPLQQKARWYPRIKLNELAAQKGMKVMLNGDFGDELFTPQPGKQNSLYGKYSEKTYQYLQTWLPTNIFGSDLRNNMRLLDALIVGEMYNALSDSCASHFGMESRPVFCHQQLAFYCFNIPTSVKSRAFQGGHDFFSNKYLLRAALDDVLPPIIKQPRLKVGWSVPWNSKTKDIMVKQTERELRVAAAKMEALKFDDSA